ncbi:hypothetical protein O1611_g1158 [Lasiodiplodia mahajangana]|uniref:Uncharacterized protein n=1 Tax=Lasiodiplodia mahajangana TaxID=1108764 RepID=A0ACC2JYI1_9PEZI|nr:hypothetical protein O1611_g1158 [Lasiodiplodia mahajangana]
MALTEADDEGDYFPFTREHSPNAIPPPEPKTEAAPLVPKPLRSLTPRGQRFSKLSDAYLNITSRQTSSNTLRKVSDQSQPSTINLDEAAPAPSHVASPRLVKSQDDIQISCSALAAPSSIKKTRRASCGSIDFFEGLSPKMGRKDSKHLSLSKEIESELLNLKAQSQDTTSSTIEGILAQYDARPSSIKVEYDNTQEYHAKLDLSISQPPKASLPEPPTTDTRLISNLRQAECDSPALDSSITDSQHLLDAEAQAYELEEASRTLVPQPLNIGQSHREIRAARDAQYAAPNNVGAGAIGQHQSYSENPFEYQEIDDYKTYLQFPMERDISQKLRHASGHVGYSAGTFRSSAYSGGYEDFPFQQTRPRGNILNPSGLPTVRTGEKPHRNIKVVIGRDSGTSKNGQNHCGARVEADNKHRDVVSEDGDWVTEATSDVGFGLRTSTLPGRPLVGGFKRAGSSIADYSDDGNEDTVDRFGSRERILQHPADKPYKPCDVRRVNDSKFGALLPRRNNGFPENANRRWESAGQQEPGQFRPQVLRKNTNPFRERFNKRIDTPKRLVFDFDQNYPPRYQFRDSVSDYEPAIASTRANCGTNQYGTHGSLQSPVSEIEEDNHPPTTDAHFERSADFDVDGNLSNGFPRQNGACQTPHHTQGFKFSIYAAERQKQLEELQRQQEFAAASSYYDPPSASSVRSKFNFELLPLNLAQLKNKRQRDNGETNETETAAARLKRKKDTLLADPGTSPIEPPARAFFTSRDLSVNFSPSDWDTHGIDLEDTPTPFALSPFSETSHNNRRKYRNSSVLETPGTPSSPDTPYGLRRLWYGQRKRHHARTEDSYQYQLRRRLIAPDDYVSDRADRIRRYCFYVIAILSILPFVGVLAMNRALSETLKWATRGEVDRLTHRQRRFIKFELAVEFAIYAGAAVAVAVYYAVESKT